MASGSYAKKPAPRNPDDIQSHIPPRATRQLPAVIDDYESPQESPVTLALAKAADVVQSLRYTRVPVRFGLVIDQFRPVPIKRHMAWLRPLIFCLICAVLFSAVLLSAGMYQRPWDQQLFSSFGGKVYDIQVGGALATTWTQSNAPIAPKVPLHQLQHAGPYSVLGKPTITADFINQVLAAYGSPAAGKGQALYDLGVKYGIDPAFALAFFQHESTFGKYGEANQSLSLGNLRCIPDAECRDNYAWFPSWEAGFEAWYKLIRNLYVAYWGLTTIPQIIPKYAPAADNNDEQAYIASVEHSIDVWHSGQIMV